MSTDEADFVLHHTFLNKSSGCKENEKDWAKSQVFFITRCRNIQKAIAILLESEVVETKLNFTCAVKKYR